MTDKPKGKPGRPSYKNGLTLDHRLKILSKIALDKNGKPSDIIAACKEITLLLNDKIKDTQGASTKTMLVFQEDKIPSKPVDNIDKIPSKPVDNIEQKPLDVAKHNIEQKDMKENENKSQDVAAEEVTNTKFIFNFQIDKQHE